MDTDLPHGCEGMTYAVGEITVPVNYVDTMREYGIQYQDGTPSSLFMEFCPFCGGRLPTSLRDEWHRRLDELGLEPGDLQVPLDMRSDAWWRLHGSESTQPGS